MTPPIHLTLLALAELAPAARWWEQSSDWLTNMERVVGRRACDWEVHRLDSETQGGRNLARVTCPECLVMLDWALEQES